MVPEGPSNLLKNFCRKKEERTGLRALRAHLEKNPVKNKQKKKTFKLRSFALEVKTHYITIGGSRFMTTKIRSVHSYVMTRTVYIFWLQLYENEWKSFSCQNPFPAAWKIETNLNLFFLSFWTFPLSESNQGGDGEWPSSIRSWYRTFWI